MALELHVKVPRSAGAPRLSSMGPVVILLLLKEVNIVVMECYYRSNPTDENGVPVKGYRQRMYREWLDRGPFPDVTEQRICDQARAIRKNGWLTELELEIRRRVLPVDTGEATTLVKEVHYFVEIDVENTEPEVRNDLNITIEEATEEQKEIVNELKEIYESGENAEKS